MMKMTEINKQEIIGKLKRRHSIVDDEQDDFLEDIIDEVVAYYLAIANDISDKEVEEVPEKHSFIIRGVGSKQFVRRGSEGLEQETVDGYRATYVQNDFAEYLSFIEALHKPENNEEENGKGKLVFF